MISPMLPEWTKISRSGARSESPCVERRTLHVEARALAEAGERAEEHVIGAGLGGEGQRASSLSVVPRPIDLTPHELDRAEAREPRAEHVRESVAQVFGVLGAVDHDWEQKQARLLSGLYAACAEKKRTRQCERKIRPKIAA